jgi:hypothetical protein
MPSQVRDFLESWRWLLHAKLQPRSADNLLKRSGVPASAQQRRWRFLALILSTNEFPLRSRGRANVRVSKNSLLDHVKWLRRAVLAAHAEFLVAGDTMQALVRRGPRHVTLHPRFQTRAGGEILVTPRLHDETDAFLGWLPYASRHFPLGADDAAFRRLARSLGLRAPELFTKRPSSKVALVVSRATAAPVRQVDGPFRSPEDHPVELQPGEHYEQFVEGELLRAWFWNETPICAERDTTPFVVGDGTSTIRELIIRRMDEETLLSVRDREVLLTRSAVVLRYHDQTLGTVLPEGARQRIEVGYGVSPPLARDDRHLLDLRSGPEPAWLPSLRDAGRRLLGAMPEAVRAGSLFTVDAILDAEQDVWLLSMNGHPTVHPLAYPVMIENLLLAAPVTDPRASVTGPMTPNDSGAARDGR